jgi:arginyl-tRNA synthetase
MPYLEMMDEAYRVLGMALRKLGLTNMPIKLEPPPHPSLGDLSTAVAFEASKVLGVRPAEAAELIKANIEMSGFRLIGGLDAVGGYLNVRARDEEYVKGIITQVAEQGNDYGSRPPSTKRKILVEHTNSNPNKALHMGIIRNSVLGDTLARLLRFMGHEVQVVNYVDDSGAQVADNVVAHLFLGYPLAAPEGMKYDHYCGSVYAEVSRRSQLDASVEEKRRLVLKMIEKGDNEASTLAKNLSKKVVSEQLKTCWRISVHFDLLNWESDIIRYGFLGKAIMALTKLGVAVRETEGLNAGCTVVKVGSLPQFSGLTNPDEVLIRSDGTATYVAKDIAYACWKLGWIGEDFRYEIWGMQPNGQAIWTTTTGGGVSEHPPFGKADMAISVIDKRQEYAQKIVKYATERIGADSMREYRHFSYEVVSLSKRTAEQISADGSNLADRQIIHMSGRKGLVINGDDVLDGLDVKAEEETRKRNPEAPREWIREVSASIAAGALRYAIIKPDVAKMLVFDIDETVRLEGDTGPYLQYTYARASKIIEKVGAGDRDPPFDVKPLSTVEVQLVKTIGKLPWIVGEAADTLTPRLVVIYAHQLADQFNEFYERHQVLRAETPELREVRLTLVKAFLQTMKNVLGLMGIEALRSM